MSVSARTQPGGTPVNWPAGARGLAVSLALFGMSAKTGWFIYPAGAVFLYTLVSPLGLGSLVLSRHFIRSVVVAGCGLAGFAGIFLCCVLMVNAPVHVISVLGGVAMVLMLASTVVGAVFQATRTVARKYMVAAGRLRLWIGALQEKLAWVRMLIALQFASQTGATSD